MSGPHLGARVTPLVDGRLSADAAARAHEHVRSCGECAEAVETESLVRARLATLGVPQVSADLVARLLDIGGPAGPLPPRDKPMSLPARPAPGTAPPSRTDPPRPSARAVGRPAGRRSRRRPVVFALAGTFSLLGAGIVGVLVLGGGHSSAPAPVAELRTTPSASASAPAPGPATATATPTAIARSTAP